MSKKCIESHIVKTNLKAKNKRVKGSQAKFSTLLKLSKCQAKKQAEDGKSEACPKPPPTNHIVKLTVRKIVIGQKLA